MAQDLITLAEYKAYKGLTKTDNDAKISLLISSVSNLIKAYIGYSLIDSYITPITERFTLDYDTDILFPNVYPITNIISVTEIDRRYNDSTIHLPLTPAADYTFTDDRIIRNYTGGYWFWPQGPNAVEIVYTAGYASTPSEVKLACYELVSYYYSEEWKTSRTIMGTTIINQTSQEAVLPPHIRAILDNYKI